MRLQKILTKTVPFALPLATSIALADEPTPSLAAAQDDLPANVAQMVPELAGVLFSEPGDGVLYAQGASWKAEFGANGSVYIPFLGADAPRNYPVAFKLASASVGGVELALRARPTVRREGDRVTLDHGSIQEIYDLAEDSVEQSFVLPSRDNAGEVVVRMNVETDLAGEAAGRGLRFAGQHGGVNYGAAFAFDKSGRRADVESHLDADALELRVPSVFPFDHAMGEDSELVIDPVMTSFAVHSALGQRHQNADIAFEKDVAGGVYLVAWERAFSSNDHDVYSVEIVKATGQVRHLSIVDSSQDDFRSPRVAGNDGGNSFLIVSEVFPQGGGGLSDIMGNLRVAGNAIVSPPRFLNDAPGASECFTPDVGGESLPFPGIWCVVYMQDLGSGRVIKAQAISSTGSPLGPARIVSSGLTNREPTISESSGDNLGDRRFNVAWTKSVSTFDTDIEACQIAPTSSGLTVVTPRFSLGELGSAHSPAVSSVASTPLAATGERPWVVASVKTSASDDVIVQVLSGSQRHDSRNISFMEDDDFTGDYLHPAVACVGDRFVLTYESSDISGGQEVFMNTFFLPETQAGATLALAERRQKIETTGNGDSLAPQLVSDWEGGLTSSDEGSLAFTYDLSGIGGRHIRAAGFAAYDTPAIGTQYCSANRNSNQVNGWLALYGGNEAGDGHVALAYDLPVGQFALMVCSQTAASVNHPGGSEGRLCIGGDIGRLTNSMTSVLPSGTALFILDSSELANSSGVVSAQAGETWHFQAWHRDVVGGSNTSNFTNAVRIEYQ